MKPLIEVPDLAEELLLDARFRLMDPAAAKRSFEEGHIPGAQFLDLEHDLSGPKTGRNGRHPLPSREALQELFSRLGVGASTDVVVYDDGDHAGAARAWMLLRWMGHERVRVLNGGLMAWRAAGLELECGVQVSVQPSDFPEREPLVTFLSKEKLEGQRLVDARAPERFRGDVEPLDPKAGHIPGAENLFYKKVLSEEGKFRSRNELERLLPKEESVFYCGSGVTAAVLLLASEVLGRKYSLYPGSWSEYSQGEGPVETGAYRRGVVAVVQGPKGLLLFERVDRPGSWQFPQGGIEGEETEEEALRREIQEEAGIAAVKVLRRGKFHTQYDWPHPTGKDDNTGQRHTWFLCELMGEPRLEDSDGSFRGWRWVSAEEALLLVVEFKKSSYMDGLHSLGLR